MEREIKFKLYNKKTKKIILNITGFAVDYNKNKIRIWCMNNEQPDGMGTELFLLKDVVLLQYSGLKDKNGQRIYEGDIINYKGLTMTVSFRNGVFGYESGSCVGDFISLGLNYHYNWENDKSNIIEIIGNIHIGPELLSQKN